VHGTLNLVFPSLPLPLSLLHFSPVITSSLIRSTLLPSTYSYDETAASSIHTITTHIIQVHYSHLLLLLLLLGGASSDDDDESLMK